MLQRPSYLMSQTQQCQSVDTFFDASVLVLCIVFLELLHSMKDLNKGQTAPEKRRRLNYYA